MLLPNLGSGINSLTLCTWKAIGPKRTKKQAPHAYACPRQVCSKGNLPAPGGGVTEVFRAPEETCPRRACEQRPPLPPAPSLAWMLPLAARQPAKCIPELCTRHTSPSSPRNPSPERERAGGSARPPLRSHSRRLPALGSPAVPSSAHLPGPRSSPV